MDSAVGFTKRSAVNGVFETRTSAQSKSEDRSSGFWRPPHRVPIHFHCPVRRTNVNPIILMFLGLPKQTAYKFPKAITSTLHVKATTVNIETKGF